jgi:hypothetical protein
MSDETDKPKRKYVRRIYDSTESFTRNDAVDAEIHSAIDDVVNDGIEVESEEVVEQPKTLGAEPTTDSTTAKMLKNLGIGGRMEPIKPWKGYDRWRCTRCGWESFDKKKAKNHVCS